MLQSVKGIYRQGKIELLETPNNLEESSVIITFLEDKPIQKHPKLMCFGMFTGDYQSTEEDFSVTEFQGDADDQSVTLLTCDQNITASGLVLTVW